MVPVPFILSEDDDGRQASPSSSSPCAMLALHQKNSEPFERLLPHQLSRPHDIPVALTANRMAVILPPVPEELLPRRASTPGPSEGGISGNEHAPYRDDAESLSTEGQSQDVGIDPGASSLLVPESRKRKILEQNLDHPHGEEEREHKRGRDEVGKQEVPKGNIDGSTPIPTRSNPSQTQEDGSVPVDPPSTSPSSRAPIPRSPTLPGTAVRRRKPSTIIVATAVTPTTTNSTRPATSSSPPSLNALLPEPSQLPPSEQPPATLPMAISPPGAEGSQPECRLVSSSPMVVASDESSPPIHSLMPLLLDVLSEIQDDERKATAIKNLKGDDAQLIIDFLYSVLSRSQLPAKVERYAWILLYKLSRSSELYPKCYTLKGIELSRVEDSGGICDIYKGHHSGQDLCLKVVRLFTPEARSTALKSLGKEAILWSGFRHPNITPFYGVYYFEPRESICLVSPWMDNGNLKAYLGRNPTVSRIPLIHDIINGLEYLHSKHVIHGDLKGVNVLVNASRRACLADFGLSTIRDDNALPFTQTTNNNSAFEIRWTAPEMLQGSERSKESDIWAFGSVCYEVLTRKVPYYECPTDLTIMYRVMERDLPTRPETNSSSGVDQVDDKMWALMERCWSTEPRDRPRCSEIKQELESGGTVEPWDDDTHMGRAIQLRQQFESAMVERKDVPIDLARVECIFRVNGSEYEAM